MKVLIIIAHADLDGKSNAHKLAHTAEESLKGAGHEVRVIDLVKKGFNVSASKDDFAHDESNRSHFDYMGNSGDPKNLKPCVLEQQENIRWCTHIIVCAPIWWHGLPSSYYCYFERVFTMNFAFDDTHTLGNGIFKDKKVMFAVTAAGSAIYYSRASHFPLEATLYPVHVGHFYYCGFQIMRSQGFYDVYDQIPDEQIEKWKKAVLNLDKRPVLPIQPRGHTESDIEVYARLPDYTLDDAINQK